MRIAIIILVSILFSCDPPSKEVSVVGNVLVVNLISDFETELKTLDRSQLSTIDEATELFKKYVSKTTNVAQKDSLFMPYFDLYNIGRVLLAHESDQVIAQYGFRNKSKEKGVDLVPVKSDYLSENVIKHLSSSMQLFCNQQLKEFEDVDDLETIALNAIWWEKFNDRHPDFFLKDMTVYHYKNWHLKNLINGTAEVSIFRDDGTLSVTANSVYKNIVKNHPKTNTARTLRKYLNLLEENDLQRTDDVQGFIESME